MMSASRLPLQPLDTPCVIPQVVAREPALSSDARQLLPLTEALIDSVLSIENLAYTHPWTHGNFADALRSGYYGRVLLQDQQVLGYFLAMQILDEIHLLNMAVSPMHHGQGLARELLDALGDWSRHTAQAQWLWLEVRESNHRARHIYERHGFTQVGARKKYYPVHQGERETAILMSMPLWP